jgi:pimeloyl-ACP methyl ester carboxylesterase
MLRLGSVMAMLLVLVGAAQSQAPEKRWLGAKGKRVQAEIFRSPDAGATPILVVILHGDLGASYHYGFAAKAAAEIHGIVAAALVRPGYKDDDGDQSDGRRGDATGDNYTSDVLHQLDVAIRQLKNELRPSITVLAGHSGGAAISADLMARDNDLAGAALLVSCPCDVPAWRQHMKTLYPYPQWDQPVPSVSPMDVVDGISPKARMSLVVGQNDTTAPPEFTQSYAERLRKHGIIPDVTVLPGLEHDILLDNVVLQKLSKLVGEVEANH